jgi:ribosomal protein S6--L-glutamate ligase
VAVVGAAANRTSARLVSEWRAFGVRALLLSAHDARGALGPGDVALGRLDVLRTLDGIEPGLFDLFLLERSGTPTLNPAVALLAAHDKLRTAAFLRAAGVPHPRTGCVRRPDDALPLAPPLVVKPRFGSWGRDVHRCQTEPEARRVLRAMAESRWFRRHGALVQEVVGGPNDLRLIVAGGRVVGAATRVAAPGEWRTNVSLGASRCTLVPDPEAVELALAAAAALSCDLVGVDLMPVGPSRYVVLELNGAVDFDEGYALPGRDIFRDVALALGLHASGESAALV